MLCTQCPGAAGRSVQTHGETDCVGCLPCRFWLGRLSTTGRSPQSPAPEDRGPSFSPAAPWAVCSAKMRKSAIKISESRVTMARLRDICQELADQGAHNLNFVNPTHYAHTLRELLENWRPPIPVVWNSGGYDQVDTLRSLEGLVNIYLPDLKYLDSGVAARYSGAPDYPKRCRCPPGDGKADGSLSV